ncbi:unnamed protein product [Pleuronectes platessa]|uniref:Uncharacterized protein n=1 Tax=Pleuronectes platessa TaxID=8262 RepID=A0A9N7Z0V8_PLEPL|nr:unnamed protein product [Pleuronectes platessa]
MSVLDTGWPAYVWGSVRGQAASRQAPAEPDQLRPIAAKYTGRLTGWQDNNLYINASSHLCSAQSAAHIKASKSTPNKTGYKLGHLQHLESDRFLLRPGEQTELILM